MTNAEEREYASSSSSSSCTDDEAEFQAPAGFARDHPTLTPYWQHVLENPEVELWLFRLPKELDMASLVGQTMDVSTDEPQRVGRFVTPEKHKYIIQQEHSAQVQPLVSILPKSSNNGKKGKVKKKSGLRLGKPFTRSYSIVKKISR